MMAQDGFRFIGLYASFPIHLGMRRVAILKAILETEELPHFETIRSGKILGKLEDSAFTERRLSDVVHSLERGEADYLQLFPYKAGDDWIQSSNLSIGIDWESHVHEPVKRSLSPMEVRFGSAGSIIVQYPLTRFGVDTASAFQLRLLRVIKDLFVKEEMHWGFIHRGFHPAAPHSVGTDDLFLETKNGYPITSFDADLSRALFFKEYAKGAFWTNFLNSTHVSKLGGIDTIRNAKPCSIIEELGQGRVLLQVGPSPLASKESNAAEDYQRLRRFLKPILMETGEDMMRIQREVLGSWKPPESADQHFRELMADIRRTNSD